MWSWHPLLVSSWRRKRRPNRVSTILQFVSDGGKRNSSPGRARYKPSNHCAGNAGVLQLYLYARVRFLCAYLHTRPRVQQAPGIPCALFFEGRTFRQTSGAMRRENADTHSTVIVREGGRSSIPEAAVMESISRGVLDTPPSRGTTVVVAIRYFTSLRAKRSNPLSPRMRKDGLLRFARNDGPLLRMTVLRLRTIRNKSLLHVIGDCASDGRL